MRYSISHPRAAEGLPVIAAVAVLAALLLLSSAAPAGAESIDVPKVTQAAAEEDVNPEPTPTSAAQTAAVAVESTTESAAAETAGVAKPVEETGVSQPVKEVETVVADSSTSVDAEQISHAVAATVSAGEGGAKAVAEAVAEDIVRKAGASLQALDRPLPGEARDLLPSIAGDPVGANREAGRGDGNAPPQPTGPPSLQASAPPFERGIDVFAAGNSWGPQPSELDFGAAPQFLSLFAPGPSADLFSALPTRPRYGSPIASGRHPGGAAPIERDRPNPASHSALSVGSGAGASFFVPIAALLALLALAAPAILRRFREAPGCRAPTPFVCALERPG